MRLFATLAAAAATTLVTGCQSTSSVAPSLAPRSAETIDPRVPVEHPGDTRPLRPALAARLAALVAEARSGDAAFQSAIRSAQRLASAAGPSHSEGWVAAQQALSAAVAARGPTSRALGDVDAMGAMGLQTMTSLTTADLAAIEAASATVRAIERAQAAQTDAIMARLSR